MWPKKRQGENLLKSEIFPLIGGADYDTLIKRQGTPLNLVPPRTGKTIHTKGIPIGCDPLDGAHRQDV
jgi:hypothetical protein